MNLRRTACALAALLATTVPGARAVDAAEAADAGTAAPAASAASAPSEADPASWIVFGQDFTSKCVARQGVGVTMHNTHPTRTVRVWMDRFHMGVGTGDRSRTDLRPGAEPDLLGCSRTDVGVQEWRLVKAQFTD